MGNKTDTAANSAFLNAELDSSAIFESILEIIESIRSDYPVTRGRIPARADEMLSSVSGESIFNAFMRAIGFPAIRDEKGLKDNATASMKSQDETINYFNYTELGLTEGQVGEIFRREEKLSSVRPLDYQPSASEENIVTGMRFMLDTIFPDAGINGVKDDKKGAIDRRFKLFPLVVCGDVHVLPLSNRLAPIFSNAGSPGGYKQQRCFLEFVLKTKITAKQSLKSSDLKEAIKQKINAIGIATGSEAADPNKNAKDSIIKNIENEEIFSLRIIQKLLQALEASANDYAKTIEDVKRYMQDVSYVPSFNGRTMFVLQGNYDITYEQIIKFLDSTDPGLKDRLGVNKKPRIDSAIDDLEASKIQSEEFFDLFVPSDPESEKPEAFANGVGSGEAYGTGTFEDVIVEICTIDRNVVAEEMEKQQAERNRIRNELEKLRSKLDIYSGHTCGFSIFDFLAIILSLYVLPVETLAGLVNKEGKTRAKEVLSGAADAIQRGKPVDQAIKDFEESVTQILNIAKAAFSRAQTGSK